MGILGQAAVWETFFLGPQRHPKTVRLEGRAVDDFFGKCNCVPCKSQQIAMLLGQTAGPCIMKRVGVIPLSAQYVEPASVKSGPTPAKIVESGFVMLHVFYRGA